MTALQEVSKFQMGMKGGFNPVLADQIYSPWFTCLCAAGRKDEELVCEHIPSH